MIDKKTTNKENEHTALTGVITGAVAVILMITVVIMSNSIALIADLINTFLEFISILITWLTLKTISTSRKDLFNYGFGKLESLSSFVIGIFLLASIVLLAVITVSRISNPVNVEGFGVWLGLIAHGIFFWINLALFRKTQQSYKKKSIHEEKIKHMQKVVQAKG